MKRNWKAKSWGYIAKAGSYITTQLFLIIQRKIIVNYNGYNHNQNL